MNQQPPDDSPAVRTVPLQVSSTVSDPLSLQEFDGFSDQGMSTMNGLWHWHGGDFSPRDSWAPSINVYRLTTRFEVCVDLAGVPKHTIDVRVDPGRLVIRGVREAPAPECEDADRLRILSMEIDHGPFCRVIVLPDHVDLGRVQSRYDNGMLWVTLPLRDPG